MGSPAQGRWWQRAIRRMASTHWGSRLVASRLQKWDRAILSLTRGRTTATTLLTGYEVILVRSKGARTGEPRITPLLAIEDRGGLLLIATNFGSHKHPAWYYNLMSAPQVEVMRRSETHTYFARELSGEEKLEAWEHAVRHFSGYAAYHARTEGRQIPVLRLTPVGPEGKSARV